MRAARLTGSRRFNSDTGGRRRFASGRERTAFLTGGGATRFDIPAVTLDDLEQEYYYYDSNATSSSAELVFERKQPKFGTWTQWFDPQLHATAPTSWLPCCRSPCDRPVDGQRVRYERCKKTDLRECPSETEWCNRSAINGLPAIILSLRRI